MWTFLIRSATSQSTSYPIFLARQDGPRFRPNPHLKLWKCRESNPRPHDKGPSINYVTRISWFFLPLPVLVTGSHISETPSHQCDVTYFAILHLEHIKLKQQKCDATTFKILSPLVTQCHASSTPSAPLNVWRNLWMSPKQSDTISPRQMRWSLLNRYR